MNNATIAWIVGAIIIVVLLGWFWAANMNTQNVPLATLPPTQESITTTPILETPTLETQTPSVLSQ
jgi:amino acid transporter